jgi:hypothetical protein
MISLGSRARGTVKSSAAISTLSTSMSWAPRRCKGARLPVRRIWTGNKDRLDIQGRDAVDRESKERVGRLGPGSCLTTVIMASNQGNFGRNWEHLEIQGGTSKFCFL